MTWKEKFWREEKCYRRQTKSRTEGSLDKEILGQIEGQAQNVLPADMLWFEVRWKTITMQDHSTLKAKGTN